MNKTMKRVAPDAPTEAVVVISCSDLTPNETMAHLLRLYGDTADLVQHADGVDVYRDGQLIGGIGVPPRAQGWVP
jgi:uncharacterized protein GlcG (DUF336 family)